MKVRTRRKGKKRTKEHVDERERGKPEGKELNTREKYQK
jgi:hypothetical protein